MRSHLAAILLLVAVLGLIVLYGCAKCPTSLPPAQALCIGIKTNFMYLDLDGDWLLVAGPFRNACNMRVVRVPAKDATAVAGPNEVSIHRDDFVFSNEAGRSEHHLANYVSEGQVWDLFGTQRPEVTLRMAVAATAAHEIGHVYLGNNLSAHVDDPGNVMEPHLVHWFPVLMPPNPVPPTFNPDQVNKIRDELEYP